MALGSASASVMLRRNRTSVVEFTFGMPAEYRGLRFRHDDAPHERLSFQAGQVIEVEDVTIDERMFAERMTNGSIAAVMGVPLLSNEERIGVCTSTGTLPSTSRRSNVRSYPRCRL